MATVMMVEKMKYAWYLLAMALAIIFLLCTILFGLLGPQARHSEVAYAYECPNDSHTWDNQTCKGVQLGKGNSQYWYELPQLSKLNSLWLLNLYPFNINYPNGDFDVNTQLQISLGIFCKEEAEGEYVSLATQTIVNASLFCLSNKEECTKIPLVYFDSINYPFYAVRVSFPNTPENQNAKSNIGDVAFDFEWGNEDYTMEEILGRLIYFIIDLTILAAFFYRLQKMPFSDWKIEQRLTCVLLSSLLFLNNPLYWGEFILPGSFFPLLDCFCIVIQQTSLLLLWLILFDYIRKGKLSLTLTKFDILKPIVVSIYSLFSFVLYGWFLLEEVSSPVIGEDLASASYFLMFFVITGIIYCAILLWVLILIGLTMKKMRDDKDKGVFYNRFLVLGTATVIMIVSMVVNLLFGNIGPIHQEAVSFMYFYGVNNAYAWILTISFWPVESNSSSNPHSREDSPIFSPYVENNFKN